MRKGYQRKTLLILLFAICSNCAIKPLQGIYTNQCILYGSPEAVVSLNADGTFLYVFPYIRGEHIEGRWSVHDDTLNLISEYLVRNDSRDPVKPEHEFARLPKLIVKGKKLYEVTINRERKQCYFKKSEKIANEIGVKAP
jgi:hypothetical protein